MEVVMTEVQKFQEALKERFFQGDSDSVQWQLLMNPVLYRSLDKDKIILGNYHVCLFGGSDTKPGDLGCVTFGVYSRIRQFRLKSSEMVECFKKAFVPKTAEETIAALDQWMNDVNKTKATWKELV
jgi:hypothetical protein